MLFTQWLSFIYETVFDKYAGKFLHSSLFVTACFDYLNHEEYQY